MAGQLVQVATNTVTSAVASVTLTGIDSDDVYMVAFLGTRSSVANNITTKEYNHILFCRRSVRASTTRTALPTSSSRSRARATTTSTVCVRTRGTASHVPTAVTSTTTARCVTTTPAVTASTRQAAVSQ